MRTGSKESSRLLGGIGRIAINRLCREGLIPGAKKVDDRGGLRWDISREGIREFKRTHRLAKGPRGVKWLPKEAKR